VELCNGLSQPAGIASSAQDCAKCMDEHEEFTREKGATEKLVAAIICIASGIHAIGAVLDQVTAITESNSG
jgi:AhpD family alkylhydroperoxidase